MLQKNKYDYKIRVEFILHIFRAECWKMSSWCFERGRLQQQHEAVSGDLIHNNWSVITGELVSVKRLQRSPGISLLSAVGRNVLFTIVSCKGIWIPKSENFLHVESGILGFGIRNRARGIPNPTKKMESGIQFPLKLESTARNPESKTVLDPGRLLGEILIECTYACTPSCTRQEC